VARLQQDWALVRVRAAQAERLKLISAAVAQNLEMVGPDPAGPAWVRARLPIEGLPHATREMLKFGPDLEVLEPATLRAALARAAAGMAALYGR
jgi:predicted DNA-binding transcriptional regulator YafY